MITSGNHNQLQSSLAPFGDLLKALMFLSNLNGFSPLPLVQGFIKGKVLPGCGRKRAPSDSITFLSIFLFLFAFLVCFALFLSQSSLCFSLFKHNFFWLFFSFVYFVFHIKIVCVLCTLVLVYLGWPLKKSFLNLVSFVA